MLLDRREKGVEDVLSLLSMTARGDSPELLSKSSPEYRAHQRIIENLERRAESLGALQDHFRHNIVTNTGIVCDRPRGDERVSVSRSYFGHGIRTVRIEQNERASDRDREWASDMREFLEMVLAVRLSILDRAANTTSHDEAAGTVEAYASIVREFEQYCSDNRIPSLLPNLYLASSLFSQLQQPAYSPKERPEVTEMYRKLAQLFSWQRSHLHAVATCAERHGALETALSCVHDAAEMRQEDVYSLFRENPLLAETYVEALFEQGKLEEALAVCEGLGDGLVLPPGVFEKWIRVLYGLHRYDELIVFLDTHARSLPDDRHLHKTLGVAHEEVGWYLYGLGRHEEAIAFLDRHMSHMIGPQGHGNMNTLYQQHLEMIGDKDRLRAFRAGIRAERGS